MAGGWPYRRIQDPGDARPLFPRMKNLREGYCYLILRQEVRRGYLFGVCVAPSKSTNTKEKILVSTMAIPSISNPVGTRLLILSTHNPLSRYQIKAKCHKSKSLHTPDWDVESSIHYTYKHPQSHFRPSHTNPKASASHCVEQPYTSPKNP